MILYHNGEWLNDDAALFQFNDRLRLGDGVFDTMLVIVKDGAAPALIHASSHFPRILHNASLIQIQEGKLPTCAAFIEIAENLIEKNNIPAGHYALNTLITRGVGRRGVMPPEDATPSITMRIAPAPDEFPPIHAIISKTVRRNEGSPLSRIKSCNYGDNILALIEAREKDANEAIMRNNAGNITCASAGNIFACIDGALVTPPLSDGAMDGITRAHLIACMDVKERSLTAADLENTNGIYITNSIRGASPVISLNGKPLPAPSITINKDFHLTQMSS